MTSKKCVKCGTPKIDSPECPNCSVIYAKAEAAQRLPNKIDKIRKIPNDEVRATARDDNENNGQLISCKICRKNISKNATSCPHCGEPNPKENQKKQSTTVDA